jgi:hypothetical protein
LILGLTRPAIFERRPLWGAGQGNHLRIELEPLSLDGSCALADVLLARIEPVPAALRDLVTHTAEGNPYFIEELIGMLIVIGATESSSSLVAQTRGWSGRESRREPQSAVKEAHAPASRIAFIALAVPRIEITRFRL